MAELFPTTLQEIVNQSGFNHQIGSTTLRTSMDVGVDKLRRRYTKGIDLFSVSIDMKISDYLTLYNFFNTTLNAGVKTFIYDHPFTGVQSEFRMSEPSMAPMGGEWVKVNMSWELMP